MGKKARARKAAEAIAAANVPSVAAATTPQVAEPIESTAAAASSNAVETASRLHSAAIHVLRRVRREDQSLGLSAARLSALSVLVFGGPRTIGRLATDEQVTPPTMTRLASAMEAEGLVVRSADAKDRRTVRLTATPKGEQMLRLGREQRVEALAAALDQLSDDEMTSLAAATAMIERALDRP